MAWPDTPRLDDWKRMQDRPLGSSSSLAPQSGVQNQYQQQAQGYDRAMRLLNRAARKGDANAALGAVKLGEQSFERGYGVSGGIRSHEQEQGAASNFENITNARTAQREAMLNQGAGAQPGQTVQNTRPLSELVSGEVSARGTVNPNSTPIGGDQQRDRYRSALDLLEGNRRMQGGQADPEDLYGRGVAAARAQGVSPDQMLDLTKGDANLKFRQTLDQALGQASSPEEIDDLRQRASRMGVASEAFDRRKNWWEKNR